MRVGLMTREYPPAVYGGAGVHVEYLSRELARSIDVEVHCWGNQHGDAGRLHVRGQQPWAALAEGPPQKFTTALEAFSLNLLQAKSLQVDIVHTHTWYVAMAGFLAKKLHGTPHVLTTHSLEPLRAWKAEQLGSGYSISSWMEHTAIHGADAIIAVSQGTKADILRAYPHIDADRIHVIYNGIDLDEYRPTPDTSALIENGVDPARPYVLFVGRITRQKGVTHLVDALAYLPNDTQVVLCAGAPDTPEIAAEMRDKVTTARRTHPNVIWIEKMLPRSAAIQMYSHCAVFCCPSVYEPFGIINLEAMACHAPVVASATGGILEVVVEGVTGCLVPFEQDRVTGFPVHPDEFSRALAARILHVLNDPARARAMGEAGRKRVEETFSWQTIAAQTITLYQSLLQNQP
ncbi:MAG: glycogen synthase [Acidobacteriaceae bacterium]